ncbi:YueH family protein [Bacillus sp. 1P06AnD]|uniref:YueH family protein n=1 Tax=Bacillus sp. 1P06AnD TaxID=3132208 RepID=UPI00399EF170
MIILQKDFNFTNYRTIKIYFQKFKKDGKCVVCIPFLSWSVEYSSKDDISQIYEVLTKSLDFHLYQGNTDKLAKFIISMTQQCT